MDVVAVLDPRIKSEDMGGPSRVENAALDGRVDPGNDNEGSDTWRRQFRIPLQRVREIDVDKYKYGFTTDIESVRAPEGLK